jgi:antirestriction protein ArdC
VHWTGAKHRLDRDLSGRFGANAYAMEELVAELGAAFLCADLAITNEPRLDHAQYVANWLQVLRNDKKAIFTASSRAQAAARYVCEFAEQNNETLDATPQHPAAPSHPHPMGPS